MHHARQGNVGAGGGGGAPEEQPQNLGGAQGDNDEPVHDGPEDNAYGPDWDDYIQEFPLGDISGGVQGLSKYISQSHGVCDRSSDHPAFDASKQKVWEAVSMFI